MQAIRDNLQYGSGYFSGRYSAFPGSLSEIGTALATKATSLITLPLPLLSALALPLYGGSSTTLSLVFFYLTWSTLVLSYGPLTVELYGTLAVRLLCFVLPALAFLAFDCALPNLSKNMKARGQRQLPSQLSQRKILEITGVALCNVFLAIVLQAVLEQFCTKILRLRSLLKVTTIVPTPWGIVTDLLKGFIVRGIVHYVVHRYLLHTQDTILKTWHLNWHHSVDFPFSLMAAYDHPVNYIFAEWLPAFVPAYLSRWHVLTWHVFLALISLEELFVFSGYSVLPSTIILAGMARRTEAHFDSVKVGKQIGNFGHLGLMDYFMGTVCKNEGTVVDDLTEEAEKRRFQERVDDAVDKAMANAEERRRSRPQEGPRNVTEDGQTKDNDDDDDNDQGFLSRVKGQIGMDQADGDKPAQRKSRRRKAT